MVGTEMCCTLVLYFYTVPAACFMLNYHLRFYYPMIQSRTEWCEESEFNGHLHVMMFGVWSTRTFTYKDSV
jgi:hypothetical protein